MEFTPNDRIATYLPARALVGCQWPLVLDSELLDYYCLENERDSVHMRQQDPFPNAQ
jgi:hypothetical protein